MRCMWYQKRIYVKVKRQLCSGIYNFQSKTYLCFLQFLSFALEISDNCENILLHTGTVPQTERRLFVHTVSSPLFNNNSTNRRYII